MGLSLSPVLLWALFVFAVCVPVLSWGMDVDVLRASDSQLVLGPSCLSHHPPLGGSNPLSSFSHALSPSLGFTIYGLPRSGLHCLSLHGFQLLRHVSLLPVEVPILMMSLPRKLHPVTSLPTDDVTPYVVVPCDVTHTPMTSFPMKLHPITSFDDVISYEL